MARSLRGAHRSRLALALSFTIAAACGQTRGNSAGDPDAGGTDTAGGEAANQPGGGEPAGGSPAAAGSDDGRGSSAASGGGNGGTAEGGSPAAGGPSPSDGGAAGNAQGGFGGEPAQPCSDDCITRGILQISPGNLHACALLADFSVKCWGQGSDGSLGYGDGKDYGRPEPLSSVGRVPVSDDPQVHVTQLAAGGFHTCALLSDGSVKCWGSNSYGRCGNGVHDDTGSITLSPGAPISVTSEPQVKVLQLVAAQKHTCALLSSGKVKCWGEGERGVLGYGNENPIGDDELPSSVEDVPVTTLAGVSATQLVVGLWHTCALLSNGSVKCWGWNDSGQLGLGKYDLIGDDEPIATAPSVEISPTAGVTAVQIAAGSLHTCALLSDDSVRCWGGQAAIGAGQPTTIGDDEAPSAWPAVEIGEPPGVKVTQLVAGGAHTCVRLSNGTAKCWGENTFGVLGYGHTKPIGDDELPSSVGAVSVTTGSATVIELATSSNVTCALLSDSTGKCWGSNGTGQLGNTGVNDVGDNELPSSIDALSLF